MFKIKLTGFSQLRRGDTVLNNPDKLRILHVINDLDGGGAQRLIIELAKNASQGFEHHALCLANEGEMTSQATAVFGTVTYLRGSRSLATLLKGIKALKRAVNDIGVDVVHSHLVQSDLVSALTHLRQGVQKVRTLHTSSVDSRDPILSRIIWFLMRILKNNIDTTVACTRSALKFAIETKQVTDSITVIPNGIVVKKNQGLESSNFQGYYLALARYHPMKDYQNLLQAFSLAKRSGMQSRLVCAGGGVERGNKEFNTLLEGLVGLENEEFLGFQQDVAKLLSRAKFLVISSAYGEALPMVGLEALSQGVPVITTDVGDCSELVTDRHFVVSAGRPEILAEALLKAENISEQEYKALSLDALKLVSQKFSLEKTISSYEDLYLRMCV